MERMSDQNELKKQAIMDVINADTRIGYYRAEKLAAAILARLELLSLSDDEIGTKKAK